MGDTEQAESVNVNRSMLWGAGVGLAFGLLIVLIILVDRAIKAHNKDQEKRAAQNAQRNEEQNNASGQSEGYFYPTKPASVTDTGFYNTLMLAEGATNDNKPNGNITDNLASSMSNGMTDGVVISTNVVGSGSNGSAADLSNKNRRNSEFEIANDNASGRFDFRPLPDDDIYTNMSVPTYPAVPPCARNDGYLGDFIFYDRPAQNDLRWDETKIDAGNIQPAFLFPHRPYGPIMGL